MVAGVSIVATVFFLNYTRGSSISGQNTLLLPGLMKQATQISKITIQDRDQTLTLERGKDYWQIVEKNNYPVLTAKIDEFLYSLADMRIIEPKTSDPNKYGQLDLNDITDNNSKAVLVTVQDGQQKDIVKLIIGRRQGIKINDEYTERLFVRKAGDPQTWLVQGLLPLTNDFKDLVEQPLLGLVDSNQIKRLTINKHSINNIVIAKSTPEQEDFVLQTAVNKPAMTLNIDTINSLPFEIAELEYTDVIPASKLQLDWSQAIHADLQTFLGVNLELNAVKQDGKVYAKVKAQALEQTSEELKQKVQAFNATHGAWYFELNDQVYKLLNSQNSDFLKQLEEHKPA